jgi:uncharacterized protein YdcH (DUF465 family)
MESKQMPDRFKPYLHKLQKLRLSDPHFQSLWDDYCEVLQVLEPTEELYRLRSDLEREIEEVLGIQP